ncbi:TetR family transcriptional regulator [Marinicella pacifica]|uniref:TetR family transcriptional regulator n=1 Tax=Marinicella pacifica TaxID=1171543 RepID=A0A917CT42_9GAMM|nr:MULTISPECIES: TetR/AcrR family transcriptional regulator [Marinicella]MCX7546106.1 TetR/AcrR family transcriptional regulator [Marinicella gelatinilytica]GGF96832.1 TetR family transcriptional regulator [Marinicella pacifica]
MTSRTKNKTAEQRRLETVETLIDLAGEQNPNAITTQALADKMGLTQGAIFRHFPTKESIFSGVMGWVAERLMKHIHKAIKSEDSAIDKLQSMFLAHISFVSKHPGIPRILFGELQHDKNSVPKQMVKQLIAQYADLLQDIMRTGKERGELNPNLDIEAATLLFIGSIQGLVMQSMLAADRQDMLAQAEAVFNVYRQSLL